MKAKGLISSIGTQAYVADVLGVTINTVCTYGRKDESELQVATLEVLKLLRRGVKISKVEKELTVDEIIKLVDACGGVDKVAKALGKNKQAIYKWQWGQSKPDKANSIMLKQYAKDRAKNDTTTIEKIRNERS